MQELTKAQKGRLAIRSFKTTADAMVLRGHYNLSGKSGQTLEKALRDISPEIYGTMNDSRCIELNGLEYVIDRLPRGIEECNRIILTAQEVLSNTTFERIEPPKRRRISYRMSEREICFVITRGVSELYDLLTHLTFLNIEAKKIHAQMKDQNGELTPVWKELDRNRERGAQLSEEQLDQAIWSLSILLGRTYQETRHTYESLEKSRLEKNSNNGLFRIVYELGSRIEQEYQNKENELSIYFTPSFQDMVGQHTISRRWAGNVKNKLIASNFQDRPLHIISANMHSVKNLLYAYPALKGRQKLSDNIFDFAKQLLPHTDEITAYALKHGLFEERDETGANMDYQIIDTAQLQNIPNHPALKINPDVLKNEKPIILVIDYAFGIQAFEAMEELLTPAEDEEFPARIHHVTSISVMGKAGILPGNKNDIMLATAHVLEGTPHNYLVNNDLDRSDFDSSVEVYVGPIVTVLGTSLQNRDVLRKFQTTSWKAVGLEMEGGHYQRAINAAIIKGHIAANVKTRYAYYASDNPLHSGQTLASGSMGEEGIRPTYMITKVILEKILYPKTDT